MKKFLLAILIMTTATVLASDCVKKRKISRQKLVHQFSESYHNAIANMCECEDGSAGYYMNFGMAIGYLDALNFCIYVD